MPFKFIVEYMEKFSNTTSVLKMTQPGFQIEGGRLI